MKVEIVVNSYIIKDICRVEVFAGNGDMIELNIESDMAFRLANDILKVQAKARKEGKNNA